MAEILRTSQRHQKHTMKITKHIARSETTASTLTVVLYHLCRNPGILERLQKETSDVFVKYEDTHAVCLEALRIFPLLPLGLSRVVPERGALIDGQFVPGGRWLEGKTGSDLLEAARSFSLGTRSCRERRLVISFWRCMVDWHGWSEMHLLWKKPEFRAKLVRKSK
ncbi:cytochrome P450 [Phaeosphaeriaceae sp. PMI808]|nr:cytochrome P450 [Phaeosphaeriaceae sp. PMI808]